MRLPPRKEIKTRRLTYHIFETDDDGRLRRPRDDRFGGESRFSEYGYETEEEAYAAIEHHSPYGAYFVIPQMNIHTEYV